MTRNQALEVIRASVALGTATPIFEEDRDAAVRRLASELEAAVIDPLPALVLGVAYPDTSLAQVLAGESPLVLAHVGTNWLGYFPSLGDFFLAYGPNPTQLNALGFHSPDALAEWRG
jgi:hypothetical protein